MFLKHFLFKFELKYVNKENISMFLILMCWLFGTKFWKVNNYSECLFLFNFLTDQFCFSWWIKFLKKKKVKHRVDILTVSMTVHSKQGLGRFHRPRCRRMGPFTTACQKKAVWFNFMFTTIHNNGPIECMAHWLRNRPSCSTPCMWKKTASVETAKTEAPLAIHVGDSSLYRV